AKQVEGLMPDSRGPAAGPGNCIGDLGPTIEEPDHPMLALEQDGLDLVGLAGEPGAEGSDLGGAVVVPAFGGALGPVESGGENATFAAVEANGLGDQAFEVPTLGRAFGAVVNGPLVDSLGD